jgi:phosphoglycerate dehydrogenase-like enzyme
MSTPQGSTTPQVGWIGLGHIGTPMAQRVRAAGFELLVWARRRAAAAPLVEAGAVWCDDVRRTSRAVATSSAPAWAALTTCWTCTGA